MVVKVKWARASNNWFLKNIKTAVKDQASIRSKSDVSVVGLLHEEAVIHHIHLYLGQRPRSKFLGGRPNASLEVLNIDGVAGARVKRKITVCWHSVEQA